MVGLIFTLPIYNPNALFLNRGDGKFFNQTNFAGVGDPGMGWGTAFVDVDNDGWQDIYVANTPSYPNVLYHNQQTANFC